MVGAAIRSTHPLLSSKTVECALTCEIGMLQIWLSSLNIVRSGMRSLNDCGRVMYSASVVESAISVCSFEDQRIGQDAYVMMYPDLDLTLFESCDVSKVHAPAKSAST